MTDCYVLRHVPFESLGILGPLLSARGLDFEILDVPVTKLPLARLRDAKLVVILGGPIGAYEEAQFPFLLDELRMLEARLASKRPTLGICLGAQLMARALGARVYPGPAKEIGWSSLQLTQAGRSGVLSAVGEQKVLHWHGDTFDLPTGARLLASTQLTLQQAFEWNETALGLQFHLEVTAADLEAWYVGHCVELAHWAGRSIGDLREDGQRFAPQLAPFARRAFDTWLEQVNPMRETLAL